MNERTNAQSLNHLLDMPKSDMSMKTGHGTLSENQPVRRAVESSGQSREPPKQIMSMGQLDIPVPRKTGSFHDTTGANA